MAAGIWSCRACKKIIAGGAWMALALLFAGTTDCWFCLVYLILPSIVPFAAYENLRRLRL